MIDKTVNKTVSFSSSPKNVIKKGIDRIEIQLKYNIKRDFRI